jgi:hypothetical protein
LFFVLSITKIIHFLKEKIINNMKNLKTIKKILVSVLSLSGAASVFVIPMTTMTSCKNNNGGKDDVSFSLPSSITINSTNDIGFSISNFSPGVTTYTSDDVKFFVVDSNYSLVRNFSFSGSANQRSIQYSQNFDSIANYKLVSYIGDKKEDSRTYSTSQINMAPTPYKHMLTSMSGNRS